MQNPIGEEVPINDLVPGEQYYAFHVRKPNEARFRSTFIKYWTMPETGYKMTLFLGGVYDCNGLLCEIGTSTCYTDGLRLRIYEPGFGQQSYRYYKVARFDRRIKKELYGRFIQHKRRQIERGLTGTRPSGLWLPRDIVREISLCYLSPKTVARRHFNLKNSCI